ncbi:MAG: hypothetical protein HFE78_03625 [Clostridiales bacterium]|nr:hypothetical protein [Clostridiales bacterium]
MDKKFLKNIAKYTITSLICLSVIAYVCYHFVVLGMNDVSIMPAEMITSEQRTEHTAYLFRNEKVLYSPNDGGVSYQYLNGEKVNRGSVVAKVYSNSEGAALKDELVGYDNKISILSRSGVDEGTRFIGTKIMDQEIGRLYSLMMEKLAAGDLDFVQQKQEELNILLNKKKIVVGDVDDYEEQIAEYEQKQEDLIAGLGSAYSEITTDSSGYFYADVDGYENIFTAGNIDNITLDDFDAMLDAKPEGTSSKGYSVGKMVTDFKWYIGFEVDLESMRKYTLNKTYDVVFPYNADATVSMRLERIVTKDNADRCLLILSSNEAPSYFHYLRVQTVYLVEQSYTGYRVPIGAVRVVDKQRGVYILKGSVVRFKRIKPLAEVDGYFIVEKQNLLNNDSVAYDLGYCDLIITEGKDLYDGKIVG